MRPNRTNIVLGVALALSLALNWGTTSALGVQGVEFAPQMAHTARYNAFAANPNFPDQQTLRTPEPGTIARGQRPLHYAPTPTDAARAGVELQNPIARTVSAAVARGAVVFLNFCQPCHGVGGRGDGLVAQRGFPPPPSLVADRAVAMADGQLFHILTYGQDNMASYASQLSQDDRWKVILRIRALQEAAPPIPVPTAAPTAQLLPPPAPREE